MNAPAPAAEVPRRLRAFLLDQTLVLVPAAAVSVATATTWSAPHAVVVGSAVLVTLQVLLGIGAGTLGRTPGRAVAGLRVIDARTGGAVGVARGVLRSLLVGLLGVATVGVGWLALALTVARDDQGRGRGWHDHLLGTEVTRDLPGSRAAGERDGGGDFGRTTSGVGTGGAGASAVGPGGVVDLTALRLGPPVVPVQRTPDAAAGAVSGTIGAPRGLRLLPHWWALESEDGTVQPVTGPVRRAGVDLAQAPDGALVVRDAGTGEGTLLVRGSVARTLVAGRVTTLLPGDRIRVDGQWWRVRGHDSPAALLQSGP